MPAKQVKNVQVEGENLAVVAYFQTETPEVVEWYDVLDGDGYTLNASSFNEVPTDAEVERLVLSLKKTQQ